MIIRILLAIAALASLLFAPIWVTAAVGAILAIAFDAWEVIILGLLIDLIYLPSSGFYYHIPMPATLAAIAFVWLMVPIRRRMFME